MNEFGNVHQDDNARAEAWKADREKEVAPLPGNGQSHYTGET